MKKTLLFLIFFFSVCAIQAQQSKSAEIIAVSDQFRDSVRQKLEHCFLSMKQYIAMKGQSAAKKRKFLRKNVFVHFSNIASIYNDLSENYVERCLSPLWGVERYFEYLDKNYKKVLFFDFEIVSIPKEIGPRNMFNVEVIKIFEGTDRRGKVFRCNGCRMEVYMEVTKKGEIQIIGIR